MGEIEPIPNHQVKVDNWPLFFLQRLHHFYRKKSHCDLTLLFSTLDTIKSIKVHKLVLHACTDYFESLDIMKDSEHGEFLQLSNEMQPDVVIPIISFMYTGKLEFPVTLQPRLYEAATKLRMTILTKLLDVQPNKAVKKSVSQQPEEPSFKVASVNNEVPASALSLGENSQDSQDLTISIMQTSYSSSPKQVEEPIVTLMPVSMIKPKQLNQNAKPGITLVQRSDVTAINTNNQIKPKVIKKSVGLQLAHANTKTKVVDVRLPPTLPGRKLPVWKRKVPLTGSQFLTEEVQNVRATFRQTVEKPKPTRFEWEEDLNDATALKPVEDALKILSHDGPVKINHPIILEPDGRVQNNRETSDDSPKRSSDGSSFESSPPHKKSRQSDLQDMKEYGKQQQLRNEIICSEENVDDVMDADDLYGPCDDDDEPDDMTNFSPANANSSTPKPILKTISKPEPPSASKRVRFSLEGKENNNNQEQQQQQQQESEASGDFTITAGTLKKTSAATTIATAITTATAKQQQSDASFSNPKIVLPMNANQIQSSKHHVKIVSEVLKKYPNLAKRENIKLRVVSKNPAAVPPTVQQAVERDAGTGNKSNSSMVSYIFLTNKSSRELLPMKTEPNDREKLFDVENKTGPWFCQVCDEVNPIEFESYYTYRRHLVEVHELKIDARICEYCGLKNSKRNHLLYHLYTKHGVDPPAHVSFPKCSECEYIALSDALLVKHKSTHDPKGLTCYTCNVVFKSYSSMQSHLTSECHALKINRREGKQIYRCPYCEALFGDGDKLGKHIVVLHWGKNNRVSSRETKDVVEEEEGDDDDDDDNDDVESFKPQSGQQFAEEAESSNAVDCPDSNPPSSELESLNNVASGIATSLSLVGNEQTVVYYEHRTEGQDIGREATVVADGECKDFVIAAPIEEANGGHCRGDGDDLEEASTENEDSNSRMSNAEESNRGTCSDHDYSEPQGEDHFRQMIPVQHPVGERISEESAVIHQMIPDQGLVFSTPSNVVFQSPCVALTPPRVLLTSQKVVLPAIAHGEQNVILSQVIPQAPIILSGQILQRPESIIEDAGSETIVFANAENQMEGIPSAVEEEQYPTETTKDPNDQNDGSEEKAESAEVTKEDELETKEEKETEEIGETIVAEEKESVEIVVDGVGGGGGGDDEGGGGGGGGTENAESNSGKVAEESEKIPPSQFKTQSRVETSKIVDDWDETNDSQQNVENRSDGPSRPDFF